MNKQILIEMLGSKYRRNQVRRDVDSLPDTEEACQEYIDHNPRLFPSAEERAFVEYRSCRSRIQWIIDCYKDDSADLFGAVAEGLGRDSAEGFSDADKRQIEKLNARMQELKPLAEAHAKWVRVNL